MKAMLSEHFSFDEMCATEHIDLREKNRIEAASFIVPARELADKLLEPMRLEFGKMHVDSWYRGPTLNKRVGGSETSQHMKGEAVDIKPLEADLDTVFAWAKDNLHYGQIIREPGWIHISLGQPYREAAKCQQALICKIVDGKKVYTPV